MSLLETFTNEQIRTHVLTIQEAYASQRQLVPPVLGHQDLCNVCGLNKILFEPPMICCSYCYNKIKRGNQMYIVQDKQGDSSEGQTDKVSSEPNWASHVSTLI